jgi:hypothetical protein
MTMQNQRDAQGFVDKVSSAVPHLAEFSNPNRWEHEPFLEWLVATWRLALAMSGEENTAAICQENLDHASAELRQWREEHKR